MRIRPLQTMNEALKTKWLWRFAIEDDALWKKVTVLKHGVDRFGWWSKRSSFAHRVGCWKSLLSSLEVRNGATVFFWHDTWCGDQPLKVLFPSLFRLARLRLERCHSA